MASVLMAKSGQSNGKMWRQLLKVLLVDELKICGSSLEEEVALVAEHVLAFTNVGSALYTLDCILKKGATVPRFDLIILALACTDYSVRTYDDAIRRLSTFFQALNRELPKVLLVLDEEVNRSIVRLSIEVRGTIVTQRIRDDASQLIRTAGQVAQRGVDMVFVGVHT